MRLRNLLTVAGALAALAATPGAAHALVPGDTKLFGLVDGVGGALCEPVSGQPAPVGSTGGDVVCALDTLTYRFRTVYDKPGGGTIVRKTSALVGVPTPLNADADLLPDLVGTITATSLSTFKLTVDRGLLETSDLPVQVEALVDGPPGALPRDSVALGYDARGGRAPNTWKGQIDLLDAPEPKTRVGLKFTKTGTTPKLAVVGGLFDGKDAENRKNPISARLAYTPVPAQVSAVLAIAVDDYEVELSTPTPARLDADVRVVDGSEDTHATTVVESLPSHLHAHYARTSKDTADVTYDATGTVTEVTMTYEQKVAGVLDTQASARLTGVPVGVEVQRTSATAGTISTTGGPLTRAEIAFGDGRSPAAPPAVDEPYLAFETAGTFDAVGDLPLSLSVRIDRLVSASFDAGKDLSVEATFGPGQPQNLSAIAKDAHSTITARLVGLPTQLDILVDTVGRHIEYDGFGKTIGSIVLRGVASPAHPFVAEPGWDHIDAAVTDLPAKVTVDFGTDGESFDIVADNAIGRVEADLRRGETGCLAHLSETGSGMAYVDTPQESCAGGRIAGVKTASFKAAPLTAQFVAAAGQSVDIWAQFGDGAEPATIDGDIDDLPAELSLVSQAAGVAQDANLGGSGKQVIAYNAKAMVKDIRLELRNLPGTMRHADFHLVDVPKKLDLAIPLGGPVKKLDVSTDGEGIGLIDLDIRSAGDRVTPPGEEDTVLVDTRDGGLHATVRVHDLVSTHLLSPLTQHELSKGTLAAEVHHDAAARPLLVDIQADDAKARLKIPTPPQDLSFTRTGDYAVPGLTKQRDTIQLRASAPIPALEFALRAETLAISGDYAHLPANFDLCVWTGYGGTYSEPDLVNASGCYQPVKAPFGQGDPFTVYDNVQISLDELGDGMAQPLQIKQMTICEDPTGESFDLCKAGNEPDHLRIENMALGEATFAFGTGVIDPAPCTAANQAALEALYGDMFESEECDDADENAGLHLYVDTDAHGLLPGKLEIKSTADDDPAEVDLVTIGKSGGPIYGDEAIRTVDLNGSPNGEYYSGPLACGGEFFITVDTSLNGVGFAFTLPAGAAQALLAC